MNKKIFVSIIVAFAMFSNVQLSAQMFYVSITPKHTIPIVGGKEGKSYAAIVKTPKGKKDVLNDTKSVLAEFGLIDAAEWKVDEISEDQSRFTFPLAIRMPIYSGSGMMGMKTIMPMVVIEGECEFEFNADGSVMISIQNMRAVSFNLTNKAGGNFNSSNIGKMTSPEKEAYTQYTNEKLMKSLSIVKGLSFAVGLIDGAPWEIAQNIQKAKDNLRETYLNDVNKEWTLCNNVEKVGQGEWLTDLQCIEYMEGLTDNPQRKTSQGMIDVAKKYYDENRLLAVWQKRWEEQVRPTYDSFFKIIVLTLGGTVSGIAEDGTQTWINIDGKVLPTDPKMQKEYIKKNLQY